VDVPIGHIMLPAVDYYVLYRKDGTMPFRKLATTGKTTYEDKTVIKGNVYIYAVTAMQKDGNESGFSHEVKITFHGVTGGAGIEKNKITAMAQSPTLRPLAISRQLNPPRELCCKL
jgi:fibronectin type 3 domain-containing protein